MTPGGAGPAAALRPVDLLAGPQARAALRDATDACTEELLAAQPHHFRRPDLDLEGSDLDSVLHRHGVRVRALYHHAVRTNEPVIAYARSVTDAGAEFRTVDRLPGHMIILDRRVAFLMAGDRSKGLVIRDPCTIECFYQFFEHLWSEGWSFPTRGSRAADPAPASATDPKPAILRMLGAGAKDETVARRLGMSVRTCRRHIAEVMAGVDAVSRFQAGALAVRHGLLGPPPEAPVTDRRQPPR